MIFLQKNIEMDKSIALIGGGGFIGTNLANFFLENDYQVLVIGRSLAEESSINCNLKRMLVDVNKTSKLIEVLDQYENIVWLVNDLVPGSSMDSLVDDFTFNVSPLVNFLEAVPKLEKLKRFIFISSGGTIYGDSTDRILLDEGSPKNPISAYGLSKIVSEKYISFITKRSHFESFILRPSNVYGNHQNLKKPQGIIGYAFKAMIDNKTIDLYAEGTVIRDFVHVQDLSAAVRCCVESKQMAANVRTYNIGSQIGYTIREVLDLMGEITGRKIQTITKPARPFDCEFNVLNINKIYSELGWKPSINLKEGLEKVWQWVDSNLKY